MEHYFNIKEAELKEAFRDKDSFNRLMLELVFSRRSYKCKLHIPEPASDPDWPKIWEDVLHDLSLYRPT